LIWSVREFSRFAPYSGFFNASSTLSPDVELALDGVQIRARQAGVAQWSCHADRLQLTKGREFANITGIRSGVLMRAGTPAASFAAGSASYRSAIYGLYNGQISLNGGIRLASLDTLGPLHTRVVASAPSMTCDTQLESLNFPEGAILNMNGIGNLRSAHVTYNFKTGVAAFGALVLQAAIPASFGLAAPMAPSGASPDSNNVTMHAADAHFDEQTHIVSTAGPVTFQQGKERLDTVGAVYNQKTFVAKALSPVTITDDTSVLTGKVGQVDFKQHVATVSDTVVLKITPKQTVATTTGGKPTADNDDSLDTASSKPTMLTCDQITYNYRTKIAQIPGHLVITQPKRTVKADSGRYDANAQVIDLDGDVVGTETDGKKIQAPHAKVSVKQGDEWMVVNGPVSAQFPVPEEDNPIPVAARKGSATPNQPAIKRPPAPPATGTPAPSSSPAAPSTQPTQITRPAPN
jgi:lipopolysaccharide export system protein LptA